MRYALTLAAGLALLAAPVAQAESILAGPNTTYLTTNVTMDQGEPLTFYSFDVPNHDVTATDKGTDGKPIFRTDLIGFGESAFVDGSQYLTTGSYGFFCTLHANMVGTLNVTGAGTPAPRPGPGAPADTKQPGVTAKVRSGGIAAVRRSRKLQVKVGVDEAATIELNAKRGNVTIATGTLSLSSAGSRREALKLTGAGRRALAGRARAAVTLTARAVDPAGNVGTARAGRTLK